MGALTLSAFCQDRVRVESADAAQRFWRAPLDAVLFSRQGLVRWVTPTRSSMRRGFACRAALSPQTGLVRRRRSRHGFPPFPHRDLSGAAGFEPFSSRTTPTYFAFQNRRRGGAAGIELFRSFLEFRRRRRTSSINRRGRLDMMPLEADRATDLVRRQTAKSPRPGLLLRRAEEVPSTFFAEQRSSVGFEN